MRVGSRRARFLVAALGVGLASASLGCAALHTGFDMLGAGLAYQRAPLGEVRALLDLPYREGSSLDKHRLDLFLPTGRRGFATLVFVHGGGWTAGDRAQRVLGIEPIRNIGRYYAARGFAVVLPSYRLQPDATWREQVEDVAAAVAWTRARVPEHGGDPDAIWLAGHSAGAWLAARVGLGSEALAAHDLTPGFVCGLVLVSGAAYDLEDEETWALGADRDVFFERFGEAGNAEWAREASVLPHLDARPPPALVLSAEGEPAKFRRQGDRLHEALAQRGADSLRVTVDGQDHQRILIGMSRDEDPVSGATLDFLASRACPRSANAPTLSRTSAPR